MLIKLNSFFAAPARLALPLALVLALALGAGACGGDSTNSGVVNAGNSNANAASPANSPDGGGTADASKYNAEIARLENEAEKNPGDEELRGALSQAYLRRANAHRAAQQLREALRDYQKALRYNQDNEEAQQRIAEISPQVEAQGTGEYGEPAPLPITPNVTGSEDADDQKPSPTPAPSPRNKKPEKP
ncbi:MAG: tetratricopeptide repeat protein [Pyrinomonadaceae bacterium]